MLLWTMITRLQIPETIYKSHVSGQCEASAVIYIKLDKELT
jgi:hypothetical protein